ncbi:MAG: 4'-phosphopantetheinyl transferase superfamily protein [Methanobrevibacter sp.]|uniref:4'-phosphopantetheinyl transferase family protein n=1 Tax=Methanobrevibacter sp. TaxID=66852 RepID=UPI0025F8F215|nr:4'-phosphopantetheinyl transferase superfamily protein [Methanobrevibacter sp.]MBQ8017000.1 4'-phosphopantetheinyl transferase superfamily protein [Methanobrevibacter sp.]MBR1611665.1 4'-phosphopantetheinyl transferase superfamily protein [Methanobrevibacter sp.]
MIKLAYVDVSDLNLSKSYNLLPKIRKVKVDNFRFDKDKKLSCGAYLLLKKLLSEENITQPAFEIGKFGKACLSNNDNIHFNLSHSGKIVACAISDMEVGVDVEYNDPTIDLNIAKHYFYNSEYENIMNSKCPSDEFFNYWVLKESYMKYTGLGFHLKLDSFEILINDEIKLKNDKNNLKFNLFDINDYKLGLCSKYNTKFSVKYNIGDLYP